MATDDKFIKQLLSLIGAAGERGLRKNELLAYLGHVDMKRFQRQLKQLHADKLIENTSKGFFRLTVPPKPAPAKAAVKLTDRTTGIFRMSPNGYGFVQIGDDCPDLFIPPDSLGSAISGDEVAFEITEPDNPKGPCARITSVVKRNRKSFVGCLWLDDYRRQTWYVTPLDRSLPDFLMIEPDSLPAGVEAGSWGEVELVQDQRDNELRGRWMKTIGNQGDVTSDLDAIVSEYNLEPPYSAAQNRACYRINPEEPSREDLTGETVVTIDPVDARDYDDALSCRPGPDGCLTVGVHIADVACYVKRNGHLDKEALTRGFTSYLPGRTLPMLPAALANDLCSLKAGEKRLAHSVFLEIELSTGKIRSWRRAHTLICSSARLCYDQVASFLDGHKVQLDAEVKELLVKLAEGARSLQKYRNKNEKFLPMDTPEIRPVCTENPSQILGVQKGSHNFAHEIVEEFMLAANQCIALELREKHIPGVFRNHPAPEEDSLQEFSAMSSIVLGRRVPVFLKRKDLVSFMNSLKEPSDREFISLLLLRHLARACYSEVPEGHYGLGKDNYCHFTSPIRRYADLSVHQQLLAFDLRRKPHTAEQMKTIGQACSSLEENNDQAAFAASDRMKIRYLAIQDTQQRRFRVFGEVVKVVKGGLSVYLPDYGLMAFVPSRELPGDGWRFDGHEMTWQNARQHLALRLRDRLKLAILTADPVRGELTLKLAK